MEGTSERGTPLLQVDPKCIQDALRAFLPPIKNDDTRLDFYTVYKKEATEYDVDYIKKYDEDLNTTLIFAGLFSAVSSAFVIDVQPKLEPDPNEQAAVLLRAILLTLNQSAVLGGIPVASPVQEDPPNEIITVTGLMYASLLISLLAAFVAMLGKQWLNRYLRHAGGSTIERCGDRQRKCDGLERWPFHLFIESLPVMLQVSLLLLACALCQHMWSVNVSVACVLIALTVLGVLFYFGIVVAGASSYECPFQTPGSAALRGIWKKIQSLASLPPHPIAPAGACVPRVLLSHILRSPWKKVVCPIVSAIHRFEQAIVQVASNSGQRIRTALRSRRHVVHHPSLSVSLEEIQEDPRMSPTPDTPPCGTSSIHGTNPSTHDTGSFHHGSDCSFYEETPAPTPENAGPWLAQEDLAAIQKTNTEDTRCVSWILRNITDPEALDAAIRFAGTIRWFEDGTDVELPYDTIVSTFHSCLDSTGTVYPGLSDRAYYSARAIAWVYIRAMSKSEEFAYAFPLPHIRNTISDDSDLHSLLRLYDIIQSPNVLTFTSIFVERSTPMHMQWASQALLHFCKTKQEDPHAFSVFRFRKIPDIPWNTIPLDAALNLCLVWSMFLGSPVEEEALKVQDKTVCLERVVSQLSHAITTAIPASHPTHPLLRRMLFELAKWESRPNCLRAMAYEWCSVICEEYPSLRDGEELLFLSLEIGFRGLDPRYLWKDARPIHSKHYQHMADVVFNGGGDEVIADLFQAWITHSFSQRPPKLLKLWAKYLIHLEGVTSTSQRLRRLAIHSVERLGFRPFKQAGVEVFTALLDRLGVGADDLSDANSRNGWLGLLLGVVQSPDGRRFLGYPYWELIPELAATMGWFSYFPAGYETQIMESLEEEQEWDMLGCWVGFVWLLRRPKINSMPEDLERVTLLLLHQRPGVAKKLVGWLQRSPIHDTPECLESLRWIRERAGLSAASRRGSLSILSVNAEARELARPPPPTFLLVGDDTY